MHLLQEKHAIIALGGNQGFGGLPPEAVIPAAIGALAGEGLAVLRQSRLFRTPCFPAGAGPDYINAAVLVTLRHDMQPSEILYILHQIEARFGRERHRRWGARTLDLDLIACGDSVLPDAETQRLWRELPPQRQAEAAPDGLILPHPRLQDRAFVLVPMAEVAPDWRHPLLGLTVREMRDALPVTALAEVVPLDANPHPGQRQDASP